MLYLLLEKLHSLLPRQSLHVPQFYLKCFLRLDQFFLNQRRLKFFNFFLFRMDSKLSILSILLKS